MTTAKTQDPRSFAPDLQVYVPSMSRFDASKTLDYIAPHWDGYIALVVPTSQVKDYRKLASKYNVEVLGCPEKGIANTRRWIGEHADDKFVMFDDDLTFGHRQDFHPVTGVDQRVGNAEGVTIGKMDHAMVPYMMRDLSRSLDHYAHVGVVGRAGSQSQPLPWTTCKRPLRVLGYRRREFLSCEHGRVKIMEDFDITLQLLTRGYRNLMWTRWTNDQRATNLPGGCSEYRTQELHNANVEIMYGFWKDFSRLVDKSNKSGDAKKLGLAERRELNIQWVKAWESSGRDLMPALPGQNKPRLRTTPPRT